MKKVLSHVGLPKRWSSKEINKKTALTDRTSWSSASNLTTMSSYGIAFGSASAAGKYHKNEDVVVDAIVLGDCGDGRMSRCPSPMESKEEELAVEMLCVDDLYFTAVFDGHGGSGCAKYMGENLHSSIVDMLSEKSFSTFQEFCESSIVADAFKQCEEDFQTMHEASPSGCCVALTIVHGTSFLLAWLGDCRAVLYSGDNVLPLTKDHRTSNQQEFNRIVQNGGSIINDRVMGILSPTRAFGDNDIKKRFPGMVSAEPTILSFTIDEDAVPSDTSFLVLATDGVFDAFTNDRVCDIVAKSLAKTNDLNESAKRLIELAGKANFDDVTASVVMWNHKLRKSRADSRAVSRHSTA